MLTPALRPLRICVDARLRRGLSGGVEQVVLGLASGLSQLRDGGEEYLFLTLQGEDEWLEPFMTGPCRVLPVRAPRPTLRLRVASALPWLARGYGSLHEYLRATAIPSSDGTVESARVDLVHFPCQEAFLTRIPSIYHPHDLQHVHLPQFFSERQRRWREVVWGGLCRQASMVAVASSWVKRDVVAHCGVPEQKVRVVPLAPLSGRASDESIASVRRKFRLPNRFMFYPAQTWPHKNHKGLLEAMALVREWYGYTIPLVGSGRMNEFCPEIRAHARRLGLEDALQLVGFVSEEELLALYACSRCIAVPSLFEAASFPLWEAFRSGVPAACSNVTSLPEQASDAALVFDPRDVASMARALHEIWTDEDLRKRLVDRGRVRVALFTWEKTARMFRAHYRRIAGYPLTADDEALIAAAPAL